MDLSLGRAGNFKNAKNQRFVVVVAARQKCGILAQSHDEQVRFSTSAT